MSTTIAQTILQQLGGNKFLAMTGASSLSSDGTTLAFRLPRCKQGITAINVELRPDDTYTIKGGRLLGSIATGNLRFAWIDTHETVYCDNLVEVFEGMTGLRTSLSR